MHVLVPCFMTFFPFVLQLFDTTNLCLLLLMYYERHFPILTGVVAFENESSLVFDVMGCLENATLFDPCPVLGGIVFS